MHQVIEDVLDEVRGAWRFRWWALAVAAGAAVVGWLVVFALSDRYVAEARVFVDTRTALKPVLQGLTVEQDVDAELNFVRQSLLAGNQMKAVALQSGVLSPMITDPAQQAKILDALADRVELSVRSASDRENERETAGSIYGITYQDSDRARSLKVVETLLSMLVEQTQGGKRAGSETAQKFLEGQIREYEQRLRAAEDRLADFKKKNIGLMPTEQGGYFAQLQSETDAVQRSETALSIATSKRAELTRQIRGDAVIGAAGSGAVVGATGLASSSDTVSRIKETQARLDELLLRFTEKHPDVVAARRTLQELQARREQEIASLRRGDAAAVAASGASGNPVYQSIQLALNQADVEIATLRGELYQHQSKAASLRQMLDTAPKVEAQFAQLNRDYDVNKSQYTALLASYEKARLGEQADSAGSVRFDIVQPPTASFGPVFPRRVLSLVGVLAGALMLGAGVAYLCNLLRPVVVSARSLGELTGLPVLGVVVAAFPEQLQEQSRRSTSLFLAGVGALMLALLFALVLNAAGLRLAVGQSLG